MAGSALAISDYELMAEIDRLRNAYRYRTMYPSLYEWQEEVVASTKSHTAVCLCAANRIGKTYTGTYIDAMHLMGDYPEGWSGHKFDNAPHMWVLGYSGEKTRDLLQYELFGRLEGKELTGGLVPADLIVDYKGMMGTTGALREVRVKHKSGGISVCQFWSYSQGQHALMGDSVDWYHIDEEPKDQSIYPQVLTRTATGDNGRGGRGILTFTPENGKTDTVMSFMDSPAGSQKFIQKGWDDAPHLSTEAKEALLEIYPAHQRDMRTKGIPMLGHGRIYDLSEDFITCDAFDIPNHWFVLDGMDFGWDHPQAHVQLIEDRDSGTFYVTKVWKQSQTSPNDAWGAVKAWAENVPTAWPHDGEQHNKEGIQTKKLYEEAGFNMLNEQASWPEGGNGVEAGLFEIRDLMRKGKFKVFRGQRGFFDEFLQYHRDEKGKIVKARDDVLDAVRYAYMMRRDSVRYGDIGKKARPLKFAQVW